MWFTLNSFDAFRLVWCRLIKFYNFFMFVHRFCFSNERQNNKQIVDKEYNPLPSLSLSLSNFGPLLVRMTVWKKIRLFALIIGDNLLRYFFFRLKIQIQSYRKKICEKKLDDKKQPKLFGSTENIYVERFVSFFFCHWLQKKNLIFGKQWRRKSSTNHHRWWSSIQNVFFSDNFIEKISQFLVITTPTIFTTSMVIVIVVVVFRGEQPTISAIAIKIIMLMMIIVEIKSSIRKYQHCQHPHRPFSQIEKNHWIVRDYRLLIYFHHHHHHYHHHRYLHYCCFCYYRFCCIRFHRTRSHRDPMIIVSINLIIVVSN